MFKKLPQKTFLTKSSYKVTKKNNILSRLLISGVLCLDKNFTFFTNLFYKMLSKTSFNFSISTSDNSSSSQLVSKVEYNSP